MVTWHFCFHKGVNSVSWPNIATCLQEIFEKQNEILLFLVLNLMVHLTQVSNVLDTFVFHMGVNSVRADGAKYRCFVFLCSPTPRKHLLRRLELTNHHNLVTRNIWKTKWDIAIFSFKWPLNTFGFNVLIMSRFVHFVWQFYFSRQLL